MPMNEDESVWVCVTCGWNEPTAALPPPVAPAQRLLRHSAADDRGDAVEDHWLRSRGVHCLGFWRGAGDRRVRRWVHDPRLAELSGGRRNRFHHLRLHLYSFPRGKKGAGRTEDFFRDHYGD